MNTSSDAAEQLVRMSLNGVEVAAKITGAGAKEIAVLLYAIMKEQGKTKGKIRLGNMIKSGQPLKIYSINDKDLQRFCTEAKKYGVLYCVLKDKNATDGMTDIMVREADAAKINRIFERFKLANIDMASIETEIQKDKEQPEADKSEEFLDRLLGEDKKEERKENFSPARTEKSNQSEPSLKSNQNPQSSLSGKPSVKEELKKIKEQLKAKYEPKPKDKKKTKKKTKNKSKGKER